VLRNDVRAGSLSLCVPLQMISLEYDSCSLSLHYNSMKFETSGNSIDVDSFLTGKKDKHAWKRSEKRTKDMAFRSYWDVALVYSASQLKISSWNLSLLYEILC
jgi:hypothetical protein